LLTPFDLFLDDDDDVDPMPPDALLAAYPPPMRAIADALRAIVRRPVPGAVERALATGLLLGVVIAGCAAAPRQTPPPGVLIPGPILTFPFARAQDGVPVLCTLEAAANPVRGIFEGDQARSSQVAWLRAPDGREMSVAWPEGFTVRFEPDAALYDEKGRPVARHGQQVELPQENLEEHAGTLIDPYIADGLVFDGCYPFAP
jgi:hypothetical protein